MSAAGGFIVTIGAHEQRCDTAEEVGSVVERYQMEHLDDPDLTGIAVRRAGAGTSDAAPVPAQRFLPQQLP